MPLVRRVLRGKEIYFGPSHVNGAFELTRVENGCLEFVTPAGVLSAADGATVLLTPSLENRPRGRVATCHQMWFALPVLEEAADALGPSASPPATPCVLGADHRLSRLMEMMAEESAAGAGLDDPGVQALHDALAFALVRQGGAASLQGSGVRRVDRRIRRALQQIEASFADPLRVDDLAATAGMGRFAFLRTFRAQVGESPYRHLTKLRLEHAAALLRRSSDSVLDIALACGFGDPGRFARLFRLRYGLSPRGYRLRSD